jgi:N-acetylmuramoyl-L-alanine amidase
VFRGETNPDDVELVSSPDDGVDVIVIDPGHGGEDPGALGVGRLKEKDIALQFARALKAELESRRKNVRVVLTRTGDYYVGLKKRYRFAESEHADVFVSLHANAHKERRARGTEVYFLTLGQATDTEARRVAELENASDLVGGAPPEAESDLLSIIADMQMKSTLSRSSLLGDNVFTALRGAKLTKTRNERQARFVALQSARIPSVLLEIGFITNPTEAKLMKDPAFRGRFCRSVADGIIEYLERTSN